MITSTSRFASRLAAASPPKPAPTITTCGRLTPFMAMASVSRPAAVDGQGRAGDGAPAGAAQEDCKRTELVDFGEALVGLCRQQDVADDLFAGDAARLGGV